MVHAQEAAWAAEHWAAQHMRFNLLVCAADKSYQAAIEQSLSIMKAIGQHDMISRAWAKKGARGSICLHAPFVKAMPLDCGTCWQAYVTPSPPHTTCALGGHTSAHAKQGCQYCQDGCIAATLRSSSYAVRDCMVALTERGSGTSTEH